MYSDEQENEQRERTDDGKPASGGVVDDRDALRQRCDVERETLRPSETADCAGASLSDQYEREEDGGS